MKTMKLSTLFGAFLTVIMQISAQQVTQCDITALVNAMPKLPQNITEAYQASYAKDASFPNAESIYTEWLTKVDSVLKEGSELTQKFYLKNPMGIAPPTQPTQSRVSPAQNAAMDAVKAEMMQKVMSDPSFAQKLMKMNEAEQRAFITKMLGGKGIVEVKGLPNMPSQQPAGMDVNWLEICTEINQSALDMSIYEAQQAVQTRYIPMHDAVNKWSEEEIKKLPLIAMGEYGHDRDPEKVKAIVQQARLRHRDIADKELKEYLPILMQQREKKAQNFESLNNELKKVNYGKTYDFGMFYPNVLQTQLFALQAIRTLEENEKGIIETCAKWQYETLLK